MLYDGLPHLVSFAYIWAVFGFFWQVEPRYRQLMFDVTKYLLILYTTRPLYYIY